MGPFLALLALPLIEITLFILVGGAIGLWPTLALVLLGALLGGALIRRAGASTMLDLRAAMQAGPGGADPSEPLARGAAMAMAGVLLALPGFFSDALAVVLLVAPLRRALGRLLGRRMGLRMQGFGATMGPRRPAAGYSPGTRHPGMADVIEGDFRAIDPAGDDAPPFRDGPENGRPDNGGPDNGGAVPGSRARPSGWTQGGQG